MSCSTSPSAAPQKMAYLKRELDACRCVLRNVNTALYSVPPVAVRDKAVGMSLLLRNTVGAHVDRCRNDRRCFMPDLMLLFFDDKTNGVQLIVIFIC